MTDKRSVCIFLFFCVFFVRFVNSKAVAIAIILFEFVAHRYFLFNKIF